MLEPHPLLPEGQEKWSEKGLDEMRLGSGSGEWEAEVIGVHDGEAFWEGWIETGDAESGREGKRDELGV